MSNVAVVVAHPDDETLGCGGTLLKHRLAGDQLSWVIATEPSTGMFTDDFRHRRETQISAVSQSYGFTNVERLGFPATGLEDQSKSEIIGRLFDILKILKPDIVYIVSGNDVHSDHRVLFDAGFVAMKPTRRGVRPYEILAFETISSTNLSAAMTHGLFCPDYYVNIQDQLEQKLSILEIYEDEVCPQPHPRSLNAVRSLAVYRGSSVGLHAAEAFRTIRRIW